MTTKKRGVILMNLGSPDSTEVKDVRRYLMQFLMDKRVIDYPYIFRKILVGAIIVPFRASKSAEAYKTIWTKEGSPLIVFTKQLRDQLQMSVTEPVAVAMRYGNPTMEAAYKYVLDQMPDVEEVLAIPMYPHYAMSSYETAVEHAREIYRKKKYRFNLQFVKPYYNDRDYIHALSEHMRPYLQQDYDHILFSYHGIPESHLKKTDVTGHHCLQSADCCQVNSTAHATCYRHQCLQTTKLVTEQLQIPKNKYSYSFQSRLGREEWLKPYTDFRLQDMPKEGIKKLLIICPAFVSDCLETLEEIAIRGKESFLSSGGESFEMIPCLNTDQLWVDAIAKWVNEFARGEQSMILK
ncbi:MAG: ferrochelatase [Bacteroidetes bacterium]|nr:ferrochelatase [Bacteroidota bacterium]